MAEKLTGAFNMTDLVAYQQGSVVSRQILTSKSGNITLFAFGEGEGLSEHTAPFDAMATVLDGTADITIDGTPHTVKVGEGIIMPANIPHALKAVQQFKMMLVMLKG